MLVRMQTSSGGGLPLNPTALRAGYAQAGTTFSQQIDLTKTYILSISVNTAGATGDHMDTYCINKGQKIILHDGSGITQDVTINGNVLSFTVASGVSTRSYCLTQLD